ncbi:anthranilate phosphoribosyltransferase [Hymenobacter roseosalivarius DSM 11622]|uniref:Anthranilate phosphoribosyltransferase n=1 Tax=Hymenobacter roseosalivarius DSM 11622 TaxID=645990 RepID=A0A1W1W4X0_9BACT|nr:anthranilate phosphoribosyltransferase [Hymenobacter roseosalivarius]SMC00510.1 anthranilate phosphoribosyltransferase [Hymenobacter roseosalivarius DSM 11622]
MKNILTTLFDQQTLTREEAREAMFRLGQGGVNPSETAAFLTVYRMRPITVPELSGFRDALLDLCRDPELGTNEVLDIVGTGGDGKDTLNISTLACFVAAGAGYKVAKHGNFGVSSVCGSSNILAHFGYDFEASSDTLRRQLDEANICFLHAAAFHPAMRHAGPVRRELGVRTFFNILGPLVNPARPAAQLAGVFSLELLRLYNYLFQQTSTRYAVVHALDGYDELSLTGTAKVVSARGEQVVTAATLGMPTYTATDLAGGQTVAESAAMFLNVLDNEGTAAQRDVVTANAALAMQCADPTLSLPDALAVARESLVSGAARGAFRKLLKV